MHCACLRSQHMRQAACFWSCRTPSWCEHNAQGGTAPVPMHLLSLPSQHSLRVVPAGAASGLGALVEVTQLTPGYCMTMKCQKEQQEQLLSVASKDAVLLDDFSHISHFQRKHTVDYACAHNTTPKRPRWTKPRPSGHNPRVLLPRGAVLHCTAYSARSTQYTARGACAGHMCRPHGWHNDVVHADEDCNDRIATPRHPQQRLQG